MAMRVLCLDAGIGQRMSITSGPGDQVGQTRSITCVVCVRTMIVRSRNIQTASVATMASRTLLDVMLVAARSTRCIGGISDANEKIAHT